VPSASGAGSAIVNFGTAPGNTDASVFVPGQTNITSTSFCEAWIDGTLQAMAPPDHSIDEHAMFAAVAGVVCRNIVPGSGFTIEVAANMRVIGNFNLLWVWYHS
jgi:hypothetical protein